MAEAGSTWLLPRPGNLWPPQQRASRWQNWLKRGNHWSRRQMQVMQMYGPDEEAADIKVNRTSLSGWYADEKGKPDNEAAAARERSLSSWYASEEERRVSVDPAKVVSLKEDSGGEVTVPSAVAHNLTEEASAAGESEAVDTGFSSDKLQKLSNPHVGALLVARDNIPRLESVFKIDLHVDDRLVAQPTMYSVQVSENEHVNLLKVPDEKGGAARYLSHLEDPNLVATITDCLIFRARRDILAGEELGFHYCTTEWAMTSPFVCAHGGARIQGYAHLDQEARLHLQRQGLLSAHVERLARNM
ncbi:unnamed protein product [Symbiodinium natans]|uniref:SET domain-containing protein n=1 Tax=Symbiodinium natans TaxID=878477 RepID=A0A812TQQ8_9DINO|nr:unnamed protein product [Symbiodinium natans]